MPYPLYGQLNITKSYHFVNKIAIDTSQQINLSDLERIFWEAYTKNWPCTAAQESEFLQNGNDYFQARYGRIILYMFSIEYFNR